MNRKWIFAVAAGLIGLSAVSPAQAEVSQKALALASPYPNDLGPGTLPESVIKSYPANVQAGYKLLLVRCAQCHTPSRPLNSRFVEPPGGIDDAAQQAALDGWKKTNPEIFKDPTVWQPEVKIWNRYVKRMMNKPGCNIARAEGKQIWEFLEYDGSHRKIGANAAKWAEHRHKLVDEFKVKYPKRYETLKAQNDL